MRDKIFLCDFNDSFTLNILSMLNMYFKKYSVKLIEFENITKELEGLVNSKSPSLVILGPGPGHPNEYERFDKVITDVLQSKHLFTLGICLGHQILCQLQGLQVRAANKPMHGHSVSYSIPQSISEELDITCEIFVQRYNSLAVKVKKSSINVLTKSGVKFFSEENEVLVVYADNFLGYQFHPESVGTENCAQFFSYAVKKFEELL